MHKTLRTFLTALAATALLVPAAGVANATPAPDKTLTVGVDIAAGWLWSSGSPDGCNVGQSHDEGFAVVMTNLDQPTLIEAHPGGVLEITGCGTVTEVTKLAKKTKKKVVGDGDWLVGPHFAKGATYVGKPAKGSFWAGKGSKYCDWETHKSFEAFAEIAMSNVKNGPLKVTSKVKVIETDGDCVWKRVR